METSLHRTLKERYAIGGSGRPEVRIGGFRVDAIDQAGRLVEVQSGALGPLQSKLRRLLPEHRVRIVKPVVLRRRVVRKLRADGPDVGTRSSPKKGSLLDVFDDLVGIVRLFPHVNLEIEVLGVTIDEVRTPRRRRPGYLVADRRLGDIRETALIARADDLWNLLPEACRGGEPFTTMELAVRLDRPQWFAQRVAYCLRMAGAAQVMGKNGNRLIYLRQQAGA